MGHVTVAELEVGADHVTATEHEVWAVHVSLAEPEVREGTWMSPKWWWGRIM